MKPKKLAKLHTVVEVITFTREAGELWKKFDAIVGELQTLPIQIPVLREATDELYKAYKTIDDYVTK